MKNLLPFLAFLSLLFFSSCSDEKINEIQSVNSNLELQDSTNKNATFLQGPRLECKGTCDDGSVMFGEGLCGITFNINTPHIQKCTCEGCTMNITGGDKRFGYTFQDLEELNVFKDAANYMSVVYNLQDDVYINFINTFKTESSYVTQFSFLDKEGVNQSFAHIIPLTKSGLGPVIIDCKGPCDDAEAKCTEQYNYETTAVSCTCQGGCNMTVTPVSDIKP